MSEVKRQMAAQSKDAKPEVATVVDAESTVETDGRPTEDAEAHRRAWADANGVDPAEMREIHYPGGWVDRFDGAGWVREEGS